MFFYDVDVSDGSLGGVGSTHIQMPPAHPHLRAYIHHAKTNPHIKQNGAGVCGKAKT